MKRFLVLVLIFLISSCSVVHPVPGNEFNLHRLPKHENDTSLLIIYKKGENINPIYAGGHWKIEINGELKSDLFENYFIPLTVKKGKHSITAKCPAGNKPTSSYSLFFDRNIVIETEGADVTYIQLEVIADPVINGYAMIGGYASPHSTQEFREINLKQVDEKEAIKTLSGFREIIGTRKGPVQ